MLNNTKKIEKDPVQFETRKLDTENLQKIRLALRETNWDTILDMNSNDGYDYIVDKIQFVTETISPKKQS